MNEEQVNKEQDKNNSRKEEIKVGLKNALDRKETLEKAKQSLINAGYDPQIVDAASKEVETLGSQKIETKPKKIKFKKIKKSEHQKIKPIKQKEQKLDNNKKLPRAVEAKPKRKRTAIYIIISIIILVLAALLGLYWDRLIGMF